MTLHLPFKTLEIKFLKISFLEDLTTLFNFNHLAGCVKSHKEVLDKNFLSSAHNLSYSSGEI